MMASLTAPASAAPGAAPGAAAQPRHHLAYLTANDRRGFALDYLHFRNMARRDPGVPLVEVTIAISEVRPFSRSDRRAVEGLVRFAERSPWLQVRAVIWKSNIGRDFSSAQACLRSIAEDAGSQDYVMVRNRSAYGPLLDDWYGAYISQYLRHPDTGLVGSTINLVGHPNLPADGSEPRHVQTYVYLSEWRHLAPMVDDFPAGTCTERMDVIAQGEIGLSRRIMESGLRISSLQWPEYAFGASTPDEPSLPHEDIKGRVGGLPFLYKFRGYLWSPAAVVARLGWMLGSLARAGR
jgi:hypothetical protein